MIKRLIKKFLQIDDINAITKNELSRYFDFEHISKYIAPLSYDKDNKFFILEDDYIGFGFIVGTKPSIGVDTLNLLENGIYQDPTFKADSIIQWTLWGSDFLHPLLDEYISRKNADNKETLEIAKQFSDYLKKKSQEPLMSDWQVPVRESIVLLSIKIPLKLKSVCDDKQAYQNEIASIKQLRESIFGTLIQAKLNPSIMTIEHYLLFARLMLNPSHDLQEVEFNYNDNIFIKDQVVSRDTILKQDDKNNGIILDKTYGKVLTIKQYPKTFTVAETREWVGSIKHLNRNQINTKFMYSLILRKPTENEKTNIFAKSGATMKQQSFSALSRKLEERQKDCVLVSKEAESGQNLWKGMMVYYLYDKDETILRNAVRTIKNMMQLHNVELQEEIVNLPFFLSSIPFNTIKEITLPSIRRANTIMSYNAAHLTPIQFDWKGSGTPTIPLISRSGQLAFVDLWDTNGGMNACVVGPMGQGKSVFVNHMIFNYRSLPKTKIRVIDVGESYVGISRLFKGNFVKPDFDHPVKINPFSHVGNLNRNMDFLINIVDTMIKPTEKCSDTERGMIQVAIREAMNKYGSDTDINTVKDEIDKIALEKNNEKFKELSDFNLSPWCSGGQYAEFMTGKSEIDLSNNLIVYELGAIKDDAKLTNVFILSIFFFMNNEIYQGDRNIKKLVIWDEAWRFANNKAVLGFIEQGAREYRKFNGSLVFITQGISDLMKNDVTKTLKNNSEYIFLFWQPPEEWERIGKDNDIYLSEYEKNIYRDTIHTVKGKYSEVLVISRSTGRGVLRLVLPRETYWIYTTDAKEVALRNKYYQQTHNVIQAVQKCIEEKG